MKNNKNNKNEHNHTEEEGICVNCYEEYLKEEGISNDGYSINPDYMTDEDVIMEIELKKEISQIFEVRVHKDHKDHFNIEEYLSCEEVQSFLRDYPSHELFDNSLDYHRVVDTKKVKHIMSGDYERKDNGRKKDYFFHYVCDDGIFYKKISSPGEETKSVDEEVEEIPKLLN